MVQLRLGSEGLGTLCGELFFQPPICALRATFRNTPRVAVAMINSLRMTLLPESDPGVCLAQSELHIAAGMEPPLAVHFGFLEVEDFCILRRRAFSHLKQHSSCNADRERRKLCNLPLRTIVPSIFKQQTLHWKYQSGAKQIGQLRCFFQQLKWHVIWQLHRALWFCFC
jgi:hypothetical protein